MSEKYSGSVHQAARDYDMSLDEAQRVYDVAEIRGESYTDALEEFIKIRATCDQ